MIQDLCILVLFGRWYGVCEEERSYLRYTFPRVGLYSSGQACSRGLTRRRLEPRSISKILLVLFVQNSPQFLSTNIYQKIINGTQKSISCHATKRFVSTIDFLFAFAFSHPTRSCFVPCPVHFFFSSFFIKSVVLLFLRNVSATFSCNDRTTGNG